jgi:hypothetical protein
VVKENKHHCSGRRRGHTKIIQIKSEHQIEETGNENGKVVEHDFDVFIVDNKT